MANTIFNILTLAISLAGFAYGFFLRVKASKIKKSRSAKKSMYIHYVDDNIFLVTPSHNRSNINKRQSNGLVIKEAVTMTNNYSYDSEYSCV